MNPSAVYDLWAPSSSTGLLPFPGALNAIHRALAGKPRIGEGYQRRPLAELAALPSVVEPSFADAMVAEGYAVPEPAIPIAVLDDAAAAGIAITRITPELLRQKWKLTAHSDCILQDAPHPALRCRDWLEAAARFLIRDRSDDLFGLPIALLANGKLAVFGLAEAKLTFSGTAEQAPVIFGLSALVHRSELYGSNGSCPAGRR